MGFCNVSISKDRSCEVGYTIGDMTAQGKGYASEAVKALVKEFSDKGFMFFTATVRQHNIASVRVLEKNDFSFCGCTKEGHLKYVFGVTENQPEEYLR